MNNKCRGIQQRKFSNIENSICLKTLTRMNFMAMLIYIFFMVLVTLIDNKWKQ